MLVVGQVVSICVVTGCCVGQVMLGQSGGSVGGGSAYILLLAEAC